MSIRPNSDFDASPSQPTSLFNRLTTTMPSLIVKLPLPERFGGPRCDTAAAPMSFPQLPLRPIRSTRTPVSTYNLPTLSGIAVRTRTKYLKKHREDVVPVPLSTRASIVPINVLSATTGKAASLPSRLAARTVQFQRSGEGEICGPNDLSVPESQETLFATDTSPSIIAADTSHKFATVHQEQLHALPEEQTKRKLQALDNHEAKKVKMDVPYAELTALSLSYLDNFGSPDFLGTPRLAAIQVSLQKASVFMLAILKHHPSSPKFPTVLTRWLDYRRALLNVQNLHTTPLLPSQIFSPFIIKIKNSRLLTELRKARDIFVSTKTRGMAVDEVLIGGFDALQTSELGGAEVGMRVQEGLKRLDEVLVRLGDELGEGAGRWVVMGQNE